MTQNTLIFGVFGAGVKKYIAIVLVSMFVIVSLPFIAVFSMGSNVLQFLSGTPSAQAAESQGFYMGEPVEGDTYAWGNCTYWAYAMRLWAGYPIPTTWGNANTWDDRAKADGYVVDQVPQVGAVYQTDDGKWGHVAYVIAVDETTGKWTISEMNNLGLNMVNTRTFARESAIFYNFIHDKEGESTWRPYSIPLAPQYTGLTSQQPL